MRRLVASLFLTSTLLGGVSAAFAYGPYSHVYAASRVAADQKLSATVAPYYVAGALLADIDKASRLRQTYKSEAAARWLQGCTGEGPIVRTATHTLSSLVTKLLAHTDPRARALGAGLRNHGVVDAYADKTAAARLGQASSGLEDLAFDVGPARERLAQASALLAQVVKSGLLTDATVRGWLAAAGGFSEDAVGTQMRGYQCFVTGFVQGKATDFAGLLRFGVELGWTKQCVAQYKLRAVTQCTPSKIRARWNAFADAHLKIVGEAVSAAGADYPKLGR